MHRFLVKSQIGGLVEVTKKRQLHQFMKVLRLKKWDYVTIFNWMDDCDYRFLIKETSKNRMILEKKEIIKKIEIRWPKLNLFQAIPNTYEKIKYILEKGTEVGVSNFFFFRSERSQKLNISDAKKDRFLKIIEETVEMSNRNTIPSLCFGSLPLQGWYEKNWINLVLDTKPSKESIYLKDLELGKLEEVSIFVWPEWGWTDRELDKLSWKRVYLGPNVFRTETIGGLVGFYILYNS